MLDERGEYKVYGQENIIANDFVRGSRFIGVEKFRELSVYEVNPGDLLITMMGTSGRCDVAPSDVALGIMDSHLLRMRLTNAARADFVRLLIDEAPYVGTQIQLAGKGSIMHGLNSSIVKNLLLFLPSIDEQTQIAAFLDRETAKIDELVTEQRRLMELLKEKRQAIISHAVTKGLNPDAPMKRSGIEWLGEVPAHWEVKRFQRCVYVAEGQVDPEDTKYSSLALIAPNHIESGSGRLLGLESASDQGAESGKYLCKAGDVVYSKIRPALRKVCIAPEDCLCSADMYPLRAHSGLTNPFLRWSMLSEQFSALAVLESQRVAMPKINRESLKEVMLSVPPIDEQQSIVAFIDIETAKLDTLTAEAQRAIDLLQERRTALVSAAVTGQIDVRALSQSTIVEPAI